MSGSPRAAVAIVAALTVVALVCVSWVAVSAQRDLDATQERLAALEEELARQERELEELRTRSGGAGLLDDLLEGLRGDVGDLDLFGGDVDGLLDQVLGGGSGLGLGADLMRCLAPGDVNGSGLADLFGDRDAKPAATTLEEEVAAVAAAVEEIRGLAFVEPVEPVFLTPAETHTRVVELFREGYSEEDAELDRRILATLGAVPADIDLRAAVEAALGDQAAGFYVPETGELVVRTTDAGDLTPMERVILAHELEHALADRHFGLPQRNDPEPGEDDAALAALALVEGDATLAMHRYTLAHLSLVEQLTMAMDPELAAAQAQLDKLPHHLRRILLFPYVEGTSFVCDLADGGWPAVDRAYSEPPLTTAEVLFPERYPDPAAAEPRRSGRLSAPWRAEIPRTFGAADLLFLLEAPAGDPDRALDDPLGRAGAWGGGSLELWVRGDDSAVALALVDSVGSGALCRSVTAWATAAFPDAGSADRRSDEAAALEGGGRGVSVTCPGDEVHVGAAPDLGTARSLIP